MNVSVCACVACSEWRLSPTAKVAVTTEKEKKEGMEMEPNEWAINQKNIHTHNESVNEREREAKVGDTDQRAH